EHADLQSLQVTLDRVITALMAIAGATGESMSRGLGWHFLVIGRRIERALLLIALLRAVLIERTEAAPEVLLLESVLAVAESHTLYRRRMRSQPQLEATLDLLLFDEKNRRSLIYQLNSALQHLATLPDQDRRPYKREMRLLMEAATQLNLASTAELAETDSGRRTRLEGMLGGLAQSLREASDALTDTYFTHAERPYQLVDEEA
ncbi:MAG: alpha-E domain-containing protein, partial [Thiohalobacterales bacterium]|nr:alpha-E domain-containing protein [Thiohalobacterales bacterium]